jgi:hypothetical protein
MHHRAPAAASVPGSMVSGNAQDGVAHRVFASFSDSRGLSGHAPWCLSDHECGARPQPDARPAVRRQLRNRRLSSAEGSPDGPCFPAEGGAGACSISANPDCPNGRIATTLGEGACTVASESRSRSSAWRLKYTALWLARGATVACAGMRSAVVTLQSQIPDNARRNPAAQALTGNRRLVQPATAKALEGVPVSCPQ